MIITEGGVTAAKGFRAGGVLAGIKKGRIEPDLALIASAVPCTAAAIYTTNLVKGAPILVTQKNLANGVAQAIICNSGNANTCNENGEEIAERMCQIAANILKIDPQDVIVGSTGVIGQPLVIEPIENAAQALGESLSGKGSEFAARAIMTTDTYKKEFAVQIGVDGKIVTIGGIAKGSGMIHPNMATMLCFITTDCKISAPMLQKAVTLAGSRTFNMISVDGDTSTNDTLSVLANGLAENTEITAEGEEYTRFYEALEGVCRRLAKLMAADGEGATKLLICDVRGAAHCEMAKVVSKSVICSSLVKAAMFGADANWGRVLCAIGYSGAAVDVGKIDVSFRSQKGRVDVCQNGAGIPFDEAAAKEILKCKEVTILVELKLGDAQGEAYGCDLTYDYVKINGDYRT
ncbi:MAG: bifunctional ornithine acetyltransferase/N-acetylglutamate synthase [Oscillospiraceae bacterium]